MCAYDAASQKCSGSISDDLIYTDFFARASVCKDTLGVCRNDIDRKKQATNNLGFTNCKAGDACDIEVPQNYFCVNNHKSGEYTKYEVLTETGTSTPQVETFFHWFYDRDYKHEVGCGYKCYKTVIEPQHIDQYCDWNDMYQKRGDNRKVERSITDNGFNFLTGKANGVVKT